LRMLREQASGPTREQRNTFVAPWLGWAIDAFDYSARFGRAAEEEGEGFTSDRFTREPASRAARAPT
jgi:hypothetical protein